MEQLQTLDINYYAMRSSSDLPEFMATLPTAEERKVFVENDNHTMTEQKAFKAIEVTDFNGHKTIVSVPSNRYQVVQHSEAFRPILEALTTIKGADYTYIGNASQRKATLQLFVNAPGYDGVSLGFAITNSFDRSTSLRYGFEMTSMRDAVIELVGYRQVCSNGMKIRVPLDQAEFVGLELKAKITTLMHSIKRYSHTTNIKSKLEEVQYITEAIALLQAPVDAMIKKAERIELTESQITAKINTWVGARRRAKVLEQLNKDGDYSLWGLYNSMTNVASHYPSKTIKSADSLINRASLMLEKELTVEVSA